MDYTQKQESGFCFENATMFQSQDMFKNGKPDIVLKTVNGLNIKRTTFMILILKNSFKLGMVDLVMLNKMWVIVRDVNVFIFLKKRSFFYFPIVFCFVFRLF